MSEQKVLIAYKRATGLVGPKLMKRLYILTSLRVIVGLFDVIGVFLLSVFSAYVIGNGVLDASFIPEKLSNFPLFKASGITILISAVLVLIFKSTCSYWLSARTTSILNKRSGEIIEEICAGLVTLKKDDLDRVSTQQLHFLVTDGVRAGSSNILRAMMIVVSESAILFMFLVLLFSTNWQASLISVTVLAATAIVLYKYAAKRLYKLGQKSGTAKIQSISTFQETFHGYRELLVLGTIRDQITKFSKIEHEKSHIDTKQTNISILPRYVLESIVMITLGFVAVIATVLNGSEEAIVIVTVFAGASARMLPSVIPLQASLSEIQTNIGLSANYLEIEALVSKIKSQKVSSNQTSKVGRESKIPTLRFENVCYAYPGSDQYAIESVSFDLDGPGWFAIDGPSGSGKSTILDLLMGVKEAQSGEILIGGESPTSYIRRNPGQCAYLPQQITISNSTIAENVAFGREIEEIDLNLVSHVLAEVGLKTIVGRSETGLLAPIGELGGNLSGGQIQRIGIARSLYVQPKVLLLDESTTGLDPEIQESILDILSVLAKEIRLISISHDNRITLRADKVMMIHEGKVL